MSAHRVVIVAGGSRYSYVGHDEWRAFAAEVKSLESAPTVRGRLPAAFEAAEIERDPERRSRLHDRPAPPFRYRTPEPDSTVMTPPTAVTHPSQMR